VDRPGDARPAGAATTASQAFTDGLQVAAAVSAVALVGVAIVAATVLLRQVRAGVDSDGRPNLTPEGVAAPGT